MADTYEALWRRVLLYAPAVPVFLARQFLLDAYKEVGDSRPWLWKVTETLIQTLASRTLTVTVTQGSTAITSAAAFVASDAGRQLRATGSLPIYSIAAFTDTSNATLDKAWAGDSGAVDVTILDRYWAAPIDFGSFHTIADPTTRRVVPFWITQEEVDAFDPHRTSSGDPARLLSPRGISAIAPTLNRALFEWWPYPTAVRTLPALYYAKPMALADTHVFQGALAERGDVLVKGALAACAQWPGTGEKPNPYFNLQLARELRAEFKLGERQIALRDDDQNPQDLGTLPWHEMTRWGLAYDTDLLRRSDASVDAYY